MNRAHWVAISGIIALMLVVGCAAPTPTAPTSPTDTAPAPTSPPPSETPVPTAEASATTAPEPTRDASPRPDAVVGFNLLSDSANNRVLLIGGLVDGADTSGATIEVWGWDGTQWSFDAELSGQVPGRTLAATAIDPQHGLVIFGGWSGSDVLGDTWLLNERQWQQINADGPTPRDHIAAAYDSARGMTIFHSGTNIDGSSMQETWGFDGSAWSLLATDGPSGRAHYSIAYDEARQQVILFGGVNSSGSLNDLWAWDGNQWTEIAAEGGTSPRNAMAMAYDPSTESILIFGGRNSRDEHLGDFWRWDGTRWEEIAVEGPPGRSFARMAYDASRGRMVLFGGYTGSRYDNPTNETWEWDGSVWEKVDG